ncbi:MAG: ribonucleoside-triphosphate reductase, adenosylcobalamin-dependent [Candidatus Nanopelagicaceae bacterium]
MAEFLKSAPSAEAVFYRTYSRRKPDGTRETFQEAMTRCVNAIAKTGNFSNSEQQLVLAQALKQSCFPSGRAFWVAGTEWAENSQNYSGWYNCTSTRVSDLESFELIMELAMMGSGTGAMLETEIINSLPPVQNLIDLVLVTDVGGVEAGQRAEETFLVSPVDSGEPEFVLVVGDSRQGWVKAYRQLLELACDPHGDDVQLIIDLGNVRPAGERLSGFGGTSNPVKLGEMFEKLAKILNKANGRQLTAIECCLLIDEAAACVVAGNIRRSAGMRQFSWDDTEALNSKSGLYSQDENGNWRVDPDKEALRMANHTSCYHFKPTLDEIEESVRSQFFSGEGAIQYVPEALLRANLDIINTPQRRERFIQEYAKNKEMAESYLVLSAYEDGIQISKKEAEHRMSRYGLNPCGEIIGSDFHCNLSEVHLNTINPSNIADQTEAFTAGALQVAALLHHQFKNERYQYSREIDPIVGVSFTGLFDFFVNAFGAEWLGWMMKGRPGNSIGKKYQQLEARYLTTWRSIVKKTINEYCERHGLRTPNRMTTVQPAGTKSLLTGASSGWHPPKAQRFIRRITFGKNDPLVSALRDWGYNVVPAQSAKDENGNLLDDILDERVQEVLVEIPTEVSWANVPGCDEFDLSQLPVESQWGLYMQVQQYYTEHNTSATIEYRENEISTLSSLIHDSIKNNTGYISAALLARFDANETFPRLPFEPIDKETFDRLNGVSESYRSALPAILQKESVSFLDVLNQYDRPDYELKGAAGCDSDKCLSEASKDGDQIGQEI